MNSIQKRSRKYLFPVLGSVFALSCGKGTSFKSENSVPVVKKPAVNSSQSAGADAGSKSQDPIKVALPATPPPAIIPISVVKDPDAAQMVATEAPKISGSVPAVEAEVKSSAPKILCPVKLMEANSHLALKRNSEVLLPVKDPDSGISFAYEAVGVLPAGMSLKGSTVSLNNEPISSASTAHFKMSLPGTENCSSDVAIDVLADGIVVTDKRLTKGAVGNIFILTDNYPKIQLPGGSTMPDFDKITPDPRPPLYIEQFSLVCPVKSALACRGPDGFIIDGYRDLKSYFGVRFVTYLVIEQEGNYEFSSVSDDGSSARIEEGPGISAPKYVVTNGGDHSISEGGSVGAVKLTKGTYKMIVDWYQGPIGEFALQMKWKAPGSSSFELIPGSLLLADKP